MNYYVDIQHASTLKPPISTDTIERWVALTLTPHRKKAELTIRFVDPPEMIKLNRDYRKQDKVTNVLSFPASYPKEIELDFPMLGDVIICPEVLLEESHALKTPLEAHWAHIIIHGVLHLLGYDHIADEDALVMQELEINLLNELGFSNPYKEEPLE